MPQVSTIKKRIETTQGKESKAGKYGAAGGAVLGGILGAIGGGGPGGAVAGASAGSSLGGLAGGMLGKPTPGTVKESLEAQPVQATSDSSLQRRLQAQQEDRLAILRQAEAALPQLPPELRDAYSAPIVQATMMEEKRRAMGMGGR